MFVYSSICVCVLFTWGIRRSTSRRHSSLAIPSYIGLPMNSTSRRFGKVLSFGEAGGKQVGGGGAGEGECERVGSVDM